jgi:hypothetical protein
MKVPTKPNHKKELEVFIQTISWAQRGNIQEACYKPNHPPVIIYRSVEEAADGEPIVVRLDKRAQKLFLVINQLEIEKQLYSFQYGSPADNLMHYLFEQHPGETVSLLDIQGVFKNFKSAAAIDSLRRKKYWKSFVAYFLPVHDKQQFRSINRIIMSASETKKLLEAFDIKWHEPERSAK